MGLLLSRSHLHGENNSPQSAFYTDRLKNELTFDSYLDKQCLQSNTMQKSEEDFD